MIERFQPDEDWRRLHLSTIGASNAAAVVGKHRFRTPWKLWHMMDAVLNKGIVPPPLPDADDLRRGNVFESVARELLANELQVPVEPHDQHNFRIRIKDRPWAHALPDAWIGEIPVELKVPRPTTVARCNTDGLIDEWRLQCQHTLEVCDCPQMIVALLDPISALLHVSRIDRDEDEIEALMEAERAFYLSVQSGAEPEPGELDQLDTPPTPEMDTLDSDEAIEAAQAFLQLSAVLKDAKATADDIKTQLRGMSGGVKAFVVSGVMRVSDPWIPGRRTFNHKLAVERFPTLADDEFWKTGDPYRRFAAKAIKTA